MRQYARVTTVRLLTCCIVSGKESLCSPPLDDNSRRSGFQTTDEPEMLVPVAASNIHVEPNRTPLPALSGTAAWLLSVYGLPVALH